MVYAVGIFGFIGGFILGLYILMQLLRGVPKERLLNDRLLKFKYGLINWACAAIGSASAVYFYKLYFEIP